MTVCFPHSAFWSQSPPAPFARKLVRSSCIRFRGFLLAALLQTGSLQTGNVQAGEWPQLLGPNRDGVAVNEAELPLKWPENGPAVVWTTKVGAGVAGLSVLQDTAVLFHREGDEEVAVCLNSRTGEERWRQTFPASYVARIVPDDGPLCAPVLTDNAVILYGAAGNLHCLERKTGKIRWSVDTDEQFNPPDSYFGSGSSPLVVDGKVLVNVGGSRTDAGVVAFQLKNGQVAWKTGAWAGSYSSPVLTRLGDQSVAIFVTRLETVGLNPATGRLLFSLPFGQRGPTVNGANPVVKGDHLFLTASYNIGNVWAKLSSENVEVERSGLMPLASQYTTPVPVGNSLIGIDGRQDGPPADLVCFDPASGKESWRETSFGYATIIRVGKQMLIMKTDGELVVAAADEEQYRELARVRLSNSTCRALPALSDGYFYFRDEQTAYCIDLRGTAARNDE